ncbi:MAG: aldehyde dehydrogenase family protein [Bacteroidetes bacterium]|nr:aldehyde dehydrogenase family protein [Bacteroidota bacterium]MBE3113221.1 aldehyde dehydrogenase family protein [Actinomycetota bacterium]
MLINSEWVKASDENWQDIRNPGTGEVIDKVPVATLQDAEKALKAAQLGKEAMGRLPAHERSAILLRIAESIEAKKAKLSELLARENGKPIQQTREEIAAAIRIYRGFAEEAKRILGRVVPMDAVPGQERHLAFTIRQPLGVVAAIIPFNYPVELCAHKDGAALAAGNAVIVKPPTDCPLTLLEIANLMEEAGLPKSAHQVITGPGRLIGEFLASSQGIQMITVTGSTEVGIKISQLAARHLKKVHLELGGNDATIICADADLEKAAEAVVLGRLARGNGQICCAVKRIFVDAKVYDRFAEILTEKAKALKVGDQLEEDTDVGPLINEEASKKVEIAISDAVKAGAKLRTGGHRNNAFIEPTVLTDVPPNVELFREETFGPVAPLVAFNNIDEAIRMANDTPYGLQAAVFTKDINRAFDIAYRLEAGGVIINWSSAIRVESLPFGGIKMSGRGREGLYDTINDMTEQKIILVHDALSVFTSK